MFFVCFRNEEVQITWKGDTFDELKDQLDQHINDQHTKVYSNANKGVGHALDSSKSKDGTKTGKDDKHNSGAVSMSEKPPSYRKAEVLKRQDAFEEKTAKDQRQSKINEEPDQTKSKSCTVL